MNILFISLLDFSSLDEHNIYSDLLKVFINHGHTLSVISPVEGTKPSPVIKLPNLRIFKPTIGPVQKVNIFKKAYSMLTLEYILKNYIKKNLSNDNFDLILYTTPPITFYSSIRYAKYRYNAKTYLLLKDIFPQNAVDLEMFSKKSIIYNFFSKKEKKLYSVSDYIGCLSPANVEYILNNNDYIDPSIVHVNPNSISPLSFDIDSTYKDKIREQYQIPYDTKVFIYGGNLGKPQDIPFIIECLKKNRDREDAFFVLCGKGTESYRIEEYIKQYNPKNLLFINGLAQNEYQKLLSACDVGLIFLDHRFTIPNFPSRALTYMENHMPIIACTDTICDFRKSLSNGDFGWWCESNSSDDFTSLIDNALSSNLIEKGENAYTYLLQNWIADKSYSTIIDKVTGTNDTDV